MVLWEPIVNLLMFGGVHAKIWYCSQSLTYLKNMFNNKICLFSVWNVNVDFEWEIIPYKMFPLKLFTKNENPLKTHSYDTLGTHC